MRNPKHAARPVSLNAVNRPDDPIAFSNTPDQHADPVMLTLDEVAALLGMSVKSVQRRIKAGVIRTVPLGGRLVRISSNELHRLAAGSLCQDEPKDPDPIK